MRTIFSVCTKSIVKHKMATFTISIPKGLKEKINEHPEINWAEYIKKRFEDRIRELRKFEELKNKGGV